MGNSANGSESVNRRRINIVDHVFSLVRLMLKLSLAGFIVYQIRLGVGALAGKETVADLALSYFSDSPSGLTVLVAITIAAVTTTWALAEGKLRRRLLSTQQNKITLLEKQLDQNRSSSGLTVGGRTNPNDY